MHTVLKTIWKCTFFPLKHNWHFQCHRWSLIHRQNGRCYTQISKPAIANAMTVRLLCTSLFYVSRRGETLKHKDEMFSLNGESPVLFFNLNIEVSFPSRKMLALVIWSLVAVLKNRFQIQLTRVNFRNFSIQLQTIHKFPQTICSWQTFQSCQDGFVQ